jgi:hypothetical protein
MENEIIKFWFEDEILYSKYLSATIGNKEIIESVIKLRMEISNHQNQYWCYDIRKLKSMNIESRNYAEKHGQDLLSACAVLVNSPVTQFIFNVFLRLKSPVIPFKSFIKEEDAIAWLKKLKLENEKTD